MKRLGIAAAPLAVGSTLLFAQSNYTHLTKHDRTVYTSVLAVPTNRVWHTHCILIGEGLETTRDYQFVTPWGRCTITHEEWEVLNRVIRRAGANTALRINEEVTR
jgi:hypothetical protein